MVVEADGRPCVCGGFGCLDAYCSRQAIEDETGRAAQRAPRAIIERTGTLVGRALVSVGAIVDLKLAVIGGTLALGFGDVFFDAVRHEVDARAKLGYLQGFTVVPVGLGHHAPLVGAAALAKFTPNAPDDSAPHAAAAGDAGPATGPGANGASDAAPDASAVGATAR
jgi:glucokinase